MLALNRSDRGVADALAQQVLAVEQGNIEARGVLAAAPGDGGKIRRLTIVFADLVDSTVLSTRLDPEPYRLLVGGYRDLVQRIVDRHDGRIASTKGDGLLVVFGHRAGSTTTRTVPCGRAWRSPERSASSATTRNADSAWGSPCEPGCIAGWCTPTSLETTFTGWPPTLLPGCPARRRRRRGGLAHRCGPGT
ncbi:adenylate and Guanylate cyclase catalytic domain protein [Mycobacterium ulcerans str. Harvey]|uniref:Adenylate and Guanylate cyclase catalytic domain protein n=1 Tax=Mycobacterium ulcerans str. Harvey TaxID=1299332 RepID=A0ABN0QZ77_MYCUL|nr:adenylate and Guanylate cyclase catalytic domain protein [Mycobacterium ulcerans str. Harvey]